jgi:HAD superfamily hydrolase (TIGR01548 family)
MSTAALLIFDMDGVLVDVTQSYRQAVIATVKHFTGAEITNTDIQARKNRGGANNDWDLALEMVRERGGSPAREEVVAVFQKISYGQNYDGLIRLERWLAGDGLLSRLARRWQFALFTGRMRWEAQYTLKRFAPQAAFDPLIGMEDVAREKPDPEGLLKILAAVQPKRAYYVGDTMDDCRAAQSAGVAFIGIAGNANPLQDELRQRFVEEGAQAVVADVNELESVIS